MSPCDVVNALDTSHTAAYMEAMDMSNTQQAFTMKLPLATLQRLDKWRGRQFPIVSRAEAIRRLLDERLEQIENEHDREE